MFQTLVVAASSVVAKVVELRGHQPFWNCELLLVYRLNLRATSLIHTSEMKVLLNLLSIISVLIFVNVKTLILLMLFLEQARGRRTWSLRVTWCPQAPRWWPLVYPIWSAERYSDGVKSFCWVSVLRMHYWALVRSYLRELVVSGRKFGHEFSIFAIKLIALKLFCILCYFLQQKVCSIVFSKYCSPNYWDFYAAYTDLYLLLHHIQSQRCRRQL